MLGRVGVGIQWGELMLCLAQILDCSPQNLDGCEDTYHDQCA